MALEESLGAPCNSTMCPNRRQVRCVGRASVLASEGSGPAQRQFSQSTGSSDGRSLSRNLLRSSPPFCRGSSPRHHFGNSKARCVHSFSDARAGLEVLLHESVAYRLFIHKESSIWTNFPIRCPPPSLQQATPGPICLVQES